MTIEQIYEELDKHQLKGIMMHADLMDLFDFLNLHGFKRQQEYQYFLESVGLRIVHRYYTNHHGKILITHHDPYSRLTPENWKNYTRDDVDTKTRRTMVEEAFLRWKKWEKETKEFYCKMFAECTANNWIADALKISDLIKDVDQELKYLERQFLELKSCDFDMLFILQEQSDLHKCYKEKLKSISTEIC